MRRVLTIGIIALVFLFLGRLDIAFASPGSDFLPSQLQSDNANPDTIPQITVTPNGQIWLAWIEDDRVIVSLPNASPLSEITPRGAGQLGQPTLSTSQGQYIAWSEIVSSTTLIHWQPFDPRLPAESHILAFPALPTFAVDHFGRIHAAWVQSDTLHYLTGSSAISQSVPLTAPATDLMISIDVTGTAYLIWTQFSSISSSAGVFFQRLESGEVPQRIAFNGMRPQVRIGSDNRIHAAYVISDTLYYANSENWQVVTAVTVGVSTTVPFALAIGPDEQANLVWVQDNILGYANESDWVYSYRSISLNNSANAISMALDSAGGAHIIYASTNESGKQDIYYTNLTTPIFQLAITTPLEGNIISQPLRAEAFCNLPPSNILRVNFYLELDEPNPDGLRTLIALGSDNDNNDGWSTEIRPVDMLVHHYQLCAVATATDGRQADTCSGSFTLLPTDWPDIWLTAPISNTSGNPIIYALLNPSSAITQLDIWAQPVSCAVNQPGCPVAGRIRYLGRNNLSSTAYTKPRWQRLSFDTVTLPDGAYLFSVAPVLETGIFTSTLPIPVMVSHTTPPKVRVLPTATRLMVSDTLVVSALVEAGDAAVTHVDYYLVRSQPLLVSPTTANAIIYSSQNELWLGSATPKDNWRIRVSLDNSWLGEGWRIKAIAFDKNGLYSSTYATASLSITDIEAPYLTFTHPQEDAILQGTVTVQVLLQPPTTTPVEMRLLIQNEYGDLVTLGDLTEANGIWVLNWDTSSLQNGRYTLVALEGTPDGRQVTAVCNGITIANTSPKYNFGNSSAGAEISGTVTFMITPTVETSETVDIYLLIQAADSHVWNIGSATLADGAYGLTWNSLSALDGPYTLTAMIQDSTGQQAYLEKPILINNATPLVTFRGTSFSEAWKGTRSICWQVSDQLDSTTVSVEYSPDGGVHWIGLAQNMGANACFSWDTRNAPDTTENRLRLTASNGRYSSRQLSNTFIVDNIAEQPILVLLEPHNGDTLELQTRIAWKSWNPDAGDLQVEIAYRLENRDWITLTGGLPATGEYLWETAGLQAKTYDLRIATRSPLGQLTPVTASKLTIGQDDTPIIRLFSLKGGESLTSEGLVLWNVPDVISNQVRIDLYYSDNAGQTWFPLAENLENTGYYQWQVSFLPAGNQYRIRIIAHTGGQTFSAESPNTFSIGANGIQQVSLLQPIPGADLVGQQLVSWYMAETSLNRLASLEIRPFGKTEWQPIIQNKHDNGFYIWDTTGWSDGLYELRLEIYDGQITTTTQLNGIVNLSNHRNHPPQVRLLGPEPGEYIDGLIPVRWQVSDRDGDSINAVLSINRVGSDEWVPITTAGAYAGYYIWDTKAITLSGDYQLSLVVDDGQNQTRSELTAPIGLLNRLNDTADLVLSVDGTSIVDNGRIAWQAQDGLGNILGVNLSLSDDSGRSWHILARNLVVESSFYLDPLKLEPGVNYVLRLNTSTGGIRKELPGLRIYKPLLPFQEPQLEIQSPEKGTTWTETQEVLWLTDDPLGRRLNISVDLSADGGLSWEALAYDAEAAGTLLWDTTQYVNGTYLLRITADNSRARLARTTEPFNLINNGRDRPILSLLYPRAGEVWSGTRLLRWQTTDPDNRTTEVSLAFSTDNGSSWQPIAVAIPDTGSYVLDTNILPNCTRVWLRATVTDGFSLNQDMSDGSIAIINPRNPVIKLMNPIGGRTCQLIQPISWVSTTTLARSLEVELTYSNNNGVTWLSIADHLPASGSYLWDTGSIPPGSSILLKAVASDGKGTTVDTLTSPLFVRQVAPSTLPFFWP